MQILKITLIAIILIASAEQLCSQIMHEYEDDPTTFTLEFNTVYTPFNIDALVDSRDIAIAQLPFPAKVTDDFPHNPMLQGSIMLDFGYMKFGLSASFLSTGTRVHYADYSGEYKFDNVITTDEISLLFKLPIKLGNPKINMNMLGEIGFSTITSTSEEFLRIFDKEDVYKDKLDNSVNFFALGLDANYSFGNFFAGGGVRFMTIPENEINIDFEGVRVHIGVGYRIVLR